MNWVRPTRIKVEKTGPRRAGFRALVETEGIVVGELKHSFESGDSTHTFALPEAWKISAATQLHAIYTAEPGGTIAAEEVTTFVLKTGSDVQLDIVWLFEKTATVKTVTLAGKPAALPSYIVMEEGSAQGSRVMIDSGYFEFPGTLESYVAKSEHPLGPIRIPESKITSPVRVEILRTDPKAREILGEFPDWVRTTHVDGALKPLVVENDKSPAARYELWFGTNRAHNFDAQGRHVFTGERSSHTTLGRCEVEVPKSHKIGSVGSPLWVRWITWTDDRLKLLRSAVMSPSHFWADVAYRIRAVPEGERCAVVFIHGFNVTFEDAALRAAQIGFDLQIQDGMFFFSWPSKGQVEDYTSDEATIEASEGAIEQFLLDVAAKSGAAAVHIIAHSMGNRALLRAIERIAARAQANGTKPFAQVILAAADVDHGVFTQRAGACQHVAARTTMYVSARDRAVEASKWLHGYPRAGLAPPVTVTPGVDTVKVTSVDVTLLGHGYFAEVRALLTDMHALITKGLAPSERFSLREATNQDGETYWEFDA